MDWRQQRQLTILLFLFAIIGTFLFSVYERYKPIPTCFDNKKNQTEQDVDCGGPCIPCQFLQTKNIEIFWAKALRAREGSYDAVAFIKNPNFYYGSLAMRYQFELFDENGTIIALRSGNTFILPNESVHIIEADMRTTLTVKSVVFKVLGADLVFVRDQLPVKDIAIVKRTYEVRTNVRGGKQSVVTAELLNNTLDQFSRAFINMLLFDKDRNIIGANRTAIEDLKPGETRTLTFIWPEVISNAIESMEGRVRVNQLLQASLGR